MPSVLTTDSELVFSTSMSVPRYVSYDDGLETSWRVAPASTGRTTGRLDTLPAWRTVDPSAATTFAFHTVVVVPSTVVVVRHARSVAPDGNTVGDVEMAQAPPTPLMTSGADDVAGKPAMSSTRTWRLGLIVPTTAPL
jgi:hypothetical protein